MSAYRLPFRENHGTIRTLSELEWEHWCAVIVAAFLVMCAGASYVVSSQIHSDLPRHTFTVSVRETAVPDDDIDSAEPVVMLGVCR